MNNEKTYKCFMITPYGKTDEEKKTFDAVFSKAIQPTAGRIPESNVVFTRADCVVPMAFEFPKQVHAHIDECHFCLADLTGLNDNVLYEMGYAKAKGKEIIAISQDDYKPDDIPIDLRHMVVTQYSVNNDNDLEFLSQKLAGLVERAIELIKNRTHSIKDVYDVKCFQNRKVADLNTAFREATDKIAILQTNLYTMSREGYLRSIESALERNDRLELRILTLDPESYFAQKRAEQIGVAIAHHRHELHNSIQSVIGRLSKFGGRFSLLIYDDFPTQITYIVDDFVYACTVARSLKSRELCTFRLNIFDAGAERSFLFHFNTIWSDAKAYEDHTLTTV